MTTKTNKVVRAIDAGYGLNKFILNTNEDGSLVCDHFPSIAVPSDAQSMKSLNIRQRDTIDVVDMGGAGSFEVGRGILQAQTGNETGREVGEHWSRAPNYRAVMLGALHYMDLKEIDLLVLGLPINQFLSEERCKELVDTYKTKIALPGGRSVNIKDVMVRPQPYGGYIDLGNHIEGLNKSISKLRESYSETHPNSELAIKPVQNATELVENLSVLIVDPGEYTLDWLLVDKGAINTKASGAASDCGRHRVVRDVHRALEQDLGRQIPPVNMSKINESLRTGVNLKLGGQIVDLKRYDTVVAQSVSDPISRLIEGLRGLEDSIDLIVLVGGHPDIYERELNRRFPFVPVFIPEQSMYANVRGFQHMGQAIVNQG